MGLVYKFFGAFLQEASKAGVDKATAVALYVRHREDTPGTVRENIGLAFAKQEIGKDRRDALKRMLDECVSAYKRSGKIVDQRDPADWATIGEGCRMRRIHKNHD